MRSELRGNKTQTGGGGKWDGADKDHETITMAQIGLDT